MSKSKADKPKTIVATELDAYRAAIYGRGAQHKPKPATAVAAEKKPAAKPAPKTGAKKQAKAPAARKPGAAKPAPKKKK